MRENSGVLFLKACYYGLFAILGAVTSTAFFSPFPKFDILPRPVFKVLYLPSLFRFNKNFFHQSKLNFHTFPLIPITLDKIFPQNVSFCRDEIQKCPSCIIIITSLKNNNKTLVEKVVAFLSNRLFFFHLNNQFIIFKIHCNNYLSVTFLIIHLKVSTVDKVGT